MRVCARLSGGIYRLLYANVFRWNRVCVAFFPLSINVTKLGLMKGTHGLSLQTVNVLYKHCTPLRAQRIALDGVGSEWLAARMKWLHR